MKKKSISFLIIICLLFCLVGCKKEENIPISEPTESVEPSAEPSAAFSAEPSNELPENQDAGVTEAIKEITATIDYSNRNFLTEKEFYDAFSKILSIHGVELSACQSDNAYFEFDYSNVDLVRMLTMSKTQEQVDEDIAAAKASVADPEATGQPDLNAGTSFDPKKDVVNSEELVTSFVICSTEAQDDQTLLFLAAAAALTVLDPNYDNTEAAFAALKNNLFSLYNNSGGQAVSWIDGVNFDESFTVPGNAIECWLGVLDDGNYYLAITPYIEYDEIVDIAGTSGSSILSSQ